MTRGRLALVFLPAMLVLALAGVLAWLVQTESGARWLWSRASAAIPGTVSVEIVEGSLRRGLLLRDLHFRNDSLAVSADRIRLAVSLDLWGRAIDIEQLDVGALVLVRQDQAEPEDDRPLASMLESLAMPVKVRFSAVAVASLELRDADGAVQVAAAEIDLAARWDQSLRLRHARARLPMGHLEASGTLAFQAPFPLELRLQGQVELPPNPADPQATVRADVQTDVQADVRADVQTSDENDARAQASAPFGAQGGIQAGAQANAPAQTPFEAHFSGDLAELHTRIRLEAPTLEITGEVRDVLTLPAADLYLRSNVLQWPLQADAPVAQLHDLAARLSGTARQYTIEATGLLSVEGATDLRAEAAATGDSRSLRLERLQLEGAPAALTLAGLLDWEAAPLVMNLEARIARLDPGPWMADWPADHPVNGIVSLALQDERLELKELDLNVAGTDFSITGSGAIDLDAELVEADLAWTGGHWPMGAAPADRTVSSDRGNVRVAGKLDDWTVDGALVLQAAEWPQGELNISGGGDRESARLLVDEGRILGGTFAGQFDYRWAPAHRWAADITARQLDLSPLYPEVPAVISGDFAASGSTAPNEIMVAIRQLDGRVRDWPVSGDGVIHIREGQVIAEALELRSGDSFVRLDGNMATPGGLQFAARVESLERFVADAGGRFAGQGRVSTAADLPQIELELSGAGLAWNTFAVGELAANVSSEAGSLRLSLQDVRAGERVVESLLLEGAGRSPWERLSLQAETPDVRLQAQLNGTLEQPGAIAGDPGAGDPGASLRWVGQIEAFRVEDPSTRFLQLQQPASLSLARDAWRLDSACFRGPSDGRLCVDGNWEQGSDAAASLDIEALSVNLVSLFIDTNMRFTQTLSGQAQWAQAAGGGAAAEVRLRLAPGSVSMAREEAELHTGEGVLEFTVRDQQLLMGRLDIPLPEVGFIHSEFDAADLSLGLDSPITGRIQATLDQINPLLRWYPQLDSLRGRFESDMRLSGTARDPRMTGHATLVRGAYEHYATGLSLTDIQLAGAVYDFDYTEFNGSFTAGEGVGRIKASVGFDNIARPEIQLELNGENLTLVDVPDLRLVADPAIALTWRDNLAQVEGRIVIPHARLSPNFLPTSTAMESPDLVIVAGEQPVENDSAFDRSKLSLQGQVEVVLGKDVAVVVERATARLSGSVTFRWDDALMPMAEGSYSVDGKVAAYGQVLEIAEGRISFPRIPADNPFLNIAAEREIYGNSQIKNAGVRITGTLRRPVLEPYTTPMTTSERALTMLVTGSDFDYEQGVGAVEAGLYIAPKLFLSYGIGLFEDSNVISARYDLGRGFGIKATSGQRETGADISYTIER